MGIVNVTPDSFSDGGRWFAPEDAIARGMRLLDEGADLLDVGGESTRPGAQRVGIDEEARRVLPVVAGLVERGAIVGIDTMRSEIARQAVEAGAVIVNDVSGGLADPEMAGVVAEVGAAYVCGHGGPSSREVDAAGSDCDVVARVRADLAARLSELEAAGILAGRIVLDPGLGFSKTDAEDVILLSQMRELSALGFPLMIGASRKRFLGAALAGTDGQIRAVGDRDAATIAVTALAAAAGAWAVRVHEAAGSSDAVRIAKFWRATPHEGHKSH